MNQASQSPESNSKRNTFSLSTLLGQIALIAVALTCWKLVNTKPNGVHAVLLWNGFVIAIATALGGFCGNFTKGFILGIGLIVAWFFLWQLVAMTGALS